jgi:hypothetical protein
MQGIGAIAVWLRGSGALLGPAPARPCGFPNLGGKCTEVAIPGAIRWRLRWARA